MEPTIKLIVAETEANKDIARHWYQSLRASLPSGILTTKQDGDGTAAMTTKKGEGKVVFTVFVTRELTEREVEVAIHTFDAKVDIDFKVEAIRTKVEVQPEIKVKIPAGPVLELCTEWAKRKHDDWVKEKTELGWRYGTKVSSKDQTHPLLRQWSDLPEEYRKVDTKQAEELLRLFNDSGYIMIKKTDLDGLKSPD